MVPPGQAAPAQVLPAPSPEQGNSSHNNTTPEIKGAPLLFLEEWYVSVNPCSTLFCVGVGVCLCEGRGVCSSFGD